MNPIKKFLIKHLLRQEEWQWFGYPNKKAWIRQTDPKVFIAASNIKHFYRGYPYVIKVSLSLFDLDDLMYNIEWDANLGHAVTTDISSWLTQNCVGNFRFDLHRVSYRFDEWVMDELGGYDQRFIAFDNEQDAVMFSLKWC